MWNRLSCFLCLHTFKEMGAARRAKHPGWKQGSTVGCCSRKPWLPALFCCETLWFGLMCCLCLAGTLVGLSGMQAATCGWQPYILHPWHGWEGAGGALWVRRKSELHYSWVCRQCTLGATFSCLLPYQHLPLGGNWLVLASFGN